VVFIQVVIEVDYRLDEAGLALDSKKGFIGKGPGNHPSMVACTCMAIRDSGLSLTNSCDSKHIGDWGCLPDLQRDIS